MWTGFSTFIKVVFTYILWKIIALYTGPTGAAVLGQFQNFLQICRALPTGLSQGIIKYVAEYKDNEEEKSKILSSSLCCYVALSIFVTLVLIVFSKEISEKVFASFAYQKTIIILAISIILYTFNNLLLSILNGELEIKKYAICNIANTILSFMLTAYLIIKHGVQGGVIGFSLNQSVALLLTVYFVTKSQWFKFSAYMQGVNKDSIIKLAQYAIVSLTPIIMVPLSLMISRQWIANELSWQEAGYWQALMRLSDGYLILMELTLSVYCIPKLSGIKLFAAFKKEIMNISLLIFPLACLGLCSIFLLKKPIVSILYSEAFFPMLPLFKYQMMGDLARIGAWFLGHIMLARAMIKILVLSEVIFNVSYVLFTLFFVHHYGLVGASMAFTINSLIQFLSILFFTIKYFPKQSFQLTTEDNISYAAIT